MDDAKTLFNEMDADNNGFLDSKEIKHFIEKISPIKPSEEEIDYMISEIDQNQDGKISFEEMELILQSREVLDINNLPKLPSLSGDYPDTNFLIIPSSGNIGFMVAKSLSKVPNFKVKCGIRKTTNPEIVKLIKNLDHVETVEVDNFSLESLKKSMNGIDKVLTYFPSTTLSLWETAISNVLEAAREKAVRCVYWISAQHDVHDNELEVFKNVQKAVDMASSINQPLVEIKPNNLATNLYSNRENVIESAQIFIGYNSNVKTVITDPYDVAEFTMKIMAEPASDHEGKKYSITGPKALSFDEIAEQLSKAIQHEETLGRRRVSNRNKLIAMFDKADVNNDGSLSKDEYLECLRQNGFSDKNANRIFELSDTNSDGKLDENEFVKAIMNFYDRKNSEDSEKITVVEMDESSFRGFCSNAGISDDDINILLSLYDSFNSGNCGENAVNTDDFYNVMGRMPKSFEEFIRENVGAFMHSHWDIVKSHSRADLLIKASFQ